MTRLTLLALIATALIAQVDTGTLSGLVTDSSGAIIPNAQVTVTQEETNTTTTLPTNGAGFFYSVPALHPGHYDVEVKKSGFQAQRKNGVELRVQDRLELNFTLAIGTASAEVTIQAAAPQLESETSSLGQVIDEKTVNDLPLNGRTFIQLATLTAGTLLSTRTQERDNFISNGARAVQNSYLLDGVDNKNLILGYDKNSAQVIQPVIDGIEEFKVQTSTFSAEFGQAAGGVVNVTMKSGTNGFHGNLFEFLRNRVLDATPFFQNGGGAPGFIQNQFGATFGGPIIKDRTFFFGSWQSSREGNAAPQTASVPIASEHSGIFPSKVTDPSTGAPFPNNTIPMSRWDPVAAGLFALYPLPNLSGTVNNFSYNPLEIVNADTYSVKIDHHFGPKDYLFGRISQGWDNNGLPTLLPAPANTQGFTSLVQRQVVVSETHTLSPNKVNEFRLGFLYTEEFQDTYGPRLFDQYGIKGAFNDPDIKGLPTFNLTGFSALGTPTALGTTPIPASGAGNRPVTKSGKVWQILDNFSWIRDKHSIKFGIDFSRVTQFAKATNSARPSFTFNGTYTGSGLGDFLLGDVNTAATSQNQMHHDPAILVYNAGMSRTTGRSPAQVDLQFRCALRTPHAILRRLQQAVQFRARRWPLLSAARPRLPGRHVQTPASAVIRFVSTTPTTSPPVRLGIAYQITPKTVIRVGSGIFYGRDEDYGISARLPSNPPWVSTATFTGTATAAPTFLLQNGFPANALALAASWIATPTPRSIANPSISPRPTSSSGISMSSRSFPAIGSRRSGTPDRRPTNSSTRPTRIRLSPEPLRSTRGVPIRVSATSPSTRPSSTPPTTPWWPSSRSAFPKA